MKKSSSAIINVRRGGSIYARVSSYV